MTDPEHRNMDAPEPDRPWEWPGAIRRDAVPGRGRFLQLLGLVAVLLAPVAGLVLGAVVWRLANDDLREMREGRMHRGGMWDEQQARQSGMIAVVSAVLSYAVAGVLLWGLRGP